jgi:hypothetical protein
MRRSLLAGCLSILLHGLAVDAHALSFTDFRWLVSGPLVLEDRRTTGQGGGLSQVRDSDFSGSQQGVVSGDQVLTWTSSGHTTASGINPGIGPAVPANSSARVEQSSAIGLQLQCAVGVSCSSPLPVRLNATLAAVLAGVAAGPFATSTATVTGKVGATQGIGEFFSGRISRQAEAFGTYKEDNLTIRGSRDFTVPVGETMLISGLFASEAIGDAPQPVPIVGGLYNATAIGQLRFSLEPRPSVNAPEPSTLLLLGASMTALAILVRRRGGRWT